MIVSASRRTDIPAFYTQWFMNRIQAGYCTVPNPFNRKQISYVSLKPDDVEVIVFWTRNPSPLIPLLEELDQLGYHSYFQYTVMDNPRALDQNTPGLNGAIRTFKTLADRVGPQRVIWRYDPIVFTHQTGVNFHIETYQKIVEELRGFTQRSVISVVDIYRKASKRLRDLQSQGMEVVPYEGKSSKNFDKMMHSLARLAAENQMEIQSCAEELDLSPYGIQPGKCIDDGYIHQIFGIEVGQKKDPSQRAECGCVVSKDIGMYDTCIFGCQYCYATKSFDLARRHYAEHDPDSPSLIGWYEPTFPKGNTQSTRSSDYQLKMDLTDPYE